VRGGEVEERADDLSTDEQLPLPGTEEPSAEEERTSGATEGPGNVTVDEPTESGGG
jgi:hypothetical protein